MNQFIDDISPLCYVYMYLIWFTVNVYPSHFVPLGKSCYIPLYCIFSFKYLIVYIVYIDILINKCKISWI